MRKKWHLVMSHMMHHPRIATLLDANLVKYIDFLDIYFIDFLRIAHFEVNLQNYLG